MTTTQEKLSELGKEKSLHSMVDKLEFMVKNICCGSDQGPVSISDDTVIRKNESYGKISAIDSIINARNKSYRRDGKSIADDIHFHSQSSLCKSHYRY